MKSSTKTFLKATALSIALALGTQSALANPGTVAPIAKPAAAQLNLTQKWDKIFPQSDKVEHRKVTFVNRFGITLAADLYMPKNLGNKKVAAIVVSGPFGAVKEQSSGLYAQTMAERGFITVAFDASYTGESGGEPRNTASPEINTEDFSAAVDFLGTLPNVDRERIGIIGICGFGGMALNVTAVDTRIKAVATSAMYDMSRYFSKGGNDAYTAENRRDVLKMVNAARWHDVDTQTLQIGEYTLGADGKVNEAVLTLPASINEDDPAVLKRFYDFYKTKRGFHKNAIHSQTAWPAVNMLGFMNFPLMTYINEIDRPMLLITGDNSHSRYYTEDAYKAANKNNAELYIVKDADHVDMYDNVNKIPFDKLQAFFEANLK